MGKTWVEICLISARGVRGSSLWKRQWYAVGWVDPNTKYRTNFHNASANPVWRTKFSFHIDDNDSNNFQDLALNLEVYSRDPVFLTEKLHGSATLLLREFLTGKSEEGSRTGHEDVGSYQLRNKNKSRGFIDVSVRVCEEDKLQETNSHLGNDEGGIKLLDRGNKPPHGGFGQGYDQQQQQHAPMPFPTNYSNPYGGYGPSYPAPPGPSFQPPRAPPPHPPPSNVGYFPNFFPGNDGTGPSYINMPSSSSAAAPARQRGPPPGFAVGAGAGALAAGAVMFGDHGNFMSGFGGDPTIAIATDPLF